MQVNVELPIIRGESKPLQRRDFIHNDGSFRQVKLKVRRFAPRQANVLVVPSPVKGSPRRATPALDRTRQCRFKGRMIPVRRLRWPSTQKRASRYIAQKSYIANMSFRTFIALMLNKT